VLGDIFESVAGAIFVDSGMSLDAVWKSYLPFLHDALGKV
jgi:endoribonuclease Dicer